MSRSDAGGGLVVVKVGGSLYDLPDLGPRLRAWLTRLGEARVLLFPGGGSAADVVRAYDRLHTLGEEASHWLALQALTLNAHFLQTLLPGAVVVPRPDLDGAPAILDPHAFALADEGRPGCLPHCWEATSDAVAARAAVVAGARRLILLKSVAVPDGLTWDEAARRGVVDGWFARVLAQAAEPPAVCAVNFRDAPTGERR